MTELVIQSTTLPEAAITAFGNELGRSPDATRGHSARWQNVAATPELKALAESYQVDIAFVPENRRRADFSLLVMDMDSTLITIECIDEIADRIGVKPQVSAITEAAMRGELDFAGALRKRVALLEGLEESALEAVYEERLRLSPGAEELIRAAQESGWKTLLISGGFTYFTHRLQARLQPVQITGHHRLHICIGAGGGDAFVLADFRTHVRRQRDPQVRQRAFEYFLHALFMRGIREALQKRDGNAFDAVLFQCRHQGFDGSFVERQQDATFGVYALRHRQAQMARHQRRRLVQKNIILREAVLPADFHEIAETFGSDERGLRALALDQRVGRQRGAEDEDVQRAGFEPGLRKDLGDGGDHGFFRRARRGEHLAGPALAARLENDVRESPADIDGETRAC